jgi:hypothetical protein
MCYDVRLKMKISQYIIVVLILACFTACQNQEPEIPEWFKPDCGPSISAPGSQTFWASQSKKLGSSGFKAAIGPNKYLNNQNADTYFYSIDVEYAYKDGSLICYSRDFKVAELPQGFINKEVNEVVSYDATSRKVTFTMGDKEHVYILPNTK